MDRPLPKRTSSDPDARMCDVASTVGLSDRAVHQIAGELVVVTQRAAENEKVGWSNCYRVVRSAHSRHGLEADLSQCEFADLVLRRHPRAD